MTMAHLNQSSISLAPMGRQTARIRPVKHDDEKIISAADYRSGCFPAGSLSGLTSTENSIRQHRSGKIFYDAAQKNQLYGCHHRKVSMGTFHAFVIHPGEGPVVN
ncbi:hypothetical protein [Pseudomonas savastanoi]